MRQVRWDPLKNEQLKQERGVSFEDLLLFGILLQDIQHPSREHQNLLLYDLGGYVWVVPYVEGDQDLFLKTLYPTRNYTKLYQEGRLLRESELEEDQVD